MTREERYNAAAEAIASIELEGLIFADDELDIIARYVEGEIDLDETAVLLRSLP